MRRPTFTVEYLTTRGAPVVLTFRTRQSAVGKAKLLVQIGREPVIYRRDARGATLVPFRPPTDRTLP